MGVPFGPLQLGGERWERVEAKGEREGEMEPEEESG